MPEGLPAPPKSIINQPELQVYITGFGTKKDDIGLAAEIDNKKVKIRSRKAKCRPSFLGGIRGIVFKGKRDAVASQAA